MAYLGRSVNHYLTYLPPFFDMSTKTKCTRQSGCHNVRLTGDCENKAGIDLNHKLGLGFVPNEVAECETT
jgi:hypothetical protein